MQCTAGAWGLFLRLCERAQESTMPLLEGDEGMDACWPRGTVEQPLLMGIKNQVEVTRF